MDRRKGPRTGPGTDRNESEPGASKEEEAVRQQLLKEHSNWTVALDGTRRWVIRRVRSEELLGRHLDIVMASEAAVAQEGRPR